MYHVQLMQRVCCNNCMQEWRLVLKDLNFILVFRPDHIAAILLRCDIGITTLSLMIFKMSELPQGADVQLHAGVGEGRRRLQRGAQVPPLARSSAGRAGRPEPPFDRAAHDE